MKRILIADDQPHVIRILAQALERDGYEVDSVLDGQAALERVRLDPPDVLITDIDMPRLDGEALCKQIVGEMPLRRFRIFVMTSRTELEHRVWAGDIDNLVFLEKPISLRKLSSLLLDYFTGSTAECRETA